MTDFEYRIFDSWYVDGGQGSGAGSTPEYTVAWRYFLERFIHEHSVRSVLDFGCGDWQFSKLINWGDCRYYGVDVVQSLIDRLQKEHGRPGVTFSLVDPVDPKLPKVDLLVTKDVLQHLPNADVERLLKKFSCASIWLLVNDQPIPGKRINPDITVGGYREIDFTKPPFSLNGTEVFRFGPPWDKVAFMVRRDSA